jgi:hypothetical protein
MTKAKGSPTKPVTAVEDFEEIAAIGALEGIRKRRVPPNKDLERERGHRAR